MTQIKLIKSKLNGKYEIYLPEHRAARPEWHNDTGWEKARLESMHSMIGKGDVVYYVGSELGEMAALCALWGAEVVNFEPNFSAWPSIYQTWEANKLPQPLANFAGFASNVHQPIPPNADGSLYKGLGYKNDVDGWPEYAYGEIIEAHGFSELYQEAQGLPQYRIDNLVAEGLKPPTVITFDCEGSDWEVLKGAEDTIRNHKPKIWASIHPEFMFHQFGEYSRDFRNWIIDHGYDEQYIDYAHELHMLYTPNGKPSK
jgi:FkbM family methyltransferase